MALKYLFEELPPGFPLLESTTGRELGSPISLEMEETRMIKIQKRNVTLKYEIGCGCYSKVYLGSLHFPILDSVDGKGKFGLDILEVAVKISNQKLSTAASCLCEVMNMTKLQHPNVVRIIGVIENGMRLPWMVMEYMPNGTLFDYVSKPKSPLGMNMILKLMADIASGMKFLHQAHDLVHGDLHSKNCFIDSSGIGKIGDFGFTSKSESGNLFDPFDSISSQTYKAALMNHCVRKVRPAHLPNFRWLPPEYLLQDDLSEFVIHKPVDVWCFGTLVFEMWSKGESPFGKLNSQEIRRAFFLGKDPFDYIKLEVPIPSTVLTLTMSCWEYKPSNRPNFDTILSMLTDNFACLSPKD